MGADLYRTLRDIRDGHITLHVRVRRYDERTGKAVPPTAVKTTSDRLPSGGGLRRMPEWWQHLADEGWLRLPDLNESNTWMLTEQATDWPARHEEH